MYYFITQIITLFYISQCKTTSIECTRSAPCSNQNITCSSNEDCTINCNDKTACSFSTIICPDNGSNSCSVACNHSLSCTHSTIQAQHSSSLSVTSNGYESLSFSNIYCPDDDSCKITYVGTQNGLSQMNIYTTAPTTDSIHVTCASTASTCWAKSNNPIAHYGDDKICTFMDTDYCQADDILIARQDIPSVTTASTTNILSSSAITTAYDIDNVLSNQLDNELQLNPYSVSISILFIFIGIIIGFILSVCCAFLYVFFQSHGIKPLDVFHRNTIIGNTPTGSPKRVIPKGQMSPALRELSPELKPTNVELDDVDFIENDSYGFHLDEGAGDVIVTVERYANSENRCDESGISSPISSTWVSFKDQSHFRTDTKDTNMSLSVCMETTTNGIAPDEFVVTGDDIATPA